MDLKADAMLAWTDVLDRSGREPGLCAWHEIESLDGRISIGLFCEAEALNVQSSWFLQQRRSLAISAEGRKNGPRGPQTGLPLFPRQRTSLNRVGMSVRCQ